MPWLAFIDGRYVLHFSNYPLWSNEAGFIRFKDMVDDSALGFLLPKDDSWHSVGFINSRVDYLYDNRKVKI